MKLVHVSPFYHPVIGGVEEVVKRIAEYMAKKSWEVYVVTYNRLRKGSIGLLPKEEEINGVHIIRLKPTFTWSHGSYSTELLESLAKLKPDIIHVHVWRHPHVFQVAKFKKRLGFKAILHPHAPFYTLDQVGMLAKTYYLLVDTLLNQTMNEYDKLLALTPIEKHLIKSTLKIPDEKIVIMPPGLDENLLKLGEKHIKNWQFPTIVVDIARINKEKMHILLIKALRHINVVIRKNIKLVLAGPDEGYLKHLIHYALKYNIELTYLGTVSPDMKRNLLKQGYIMAHPSPYEGFGLSLIEAQAFGTPCVITGYGGQIYAAPPTITSVHVDPNPKSFAEAIEMLIKNRSLYRKLSGNAKVWVKKFAWSNILMGYEKLLKELQSG